MGSNCDKKSGNLFWALTLPKHIHQQLGTYHQFLGKFLLKGPKVRPENLHITLLFHGQMDFEHRAQLIEKSKKISSIPPFEIAIHGLNFFFHRHGGVIFIPIVEGLHHLQEIHSQLDTQLAGKKLFRQYNPHLTLMRFKGDIPWEEMEEEAEKLPIARFTVNKIFLLEGPGGIKPYTQHLSRPLTS